MAELHFLRPAWLLMLIPIVLVIPWALKRAFYHSAWQQHVDAELLPHVLVATGGKRSRWPLLGLFVLWLSAVIVLAGPTWQRIPPVQYQPKVPPLVIALDLSRSMLVRDLFPSRLNVAKNKIRMLLQQTSSRPVSLIAYSLTPHVVMPFTRDWELINQMLVALDSDLMPARGSRSSGAIEKAITLLQQVDARQGDILLVTDSVDGPSARVAETAASLGYQLSVLGVGTEAGGTVPSDGTGYLRGRHGTIHSSLQVQQLKRVAEAGEGGYVSVSRGQQDIEALLQLLGNPGLEHGSAENVGGEVWREAGPYVLLLIVPMLLVAFRHGVIVGVLLSVFLLHPQQNIEAAEINQLWLNAQQRGAALLKQERYLEAADVFKHPLWIGIAQYRAGLYSDALESFQQLDSAVGHFNRGNTLFKLGHWSQAVLAYQSALDRDPQLSDAETNKKLVTRLIRLRSLKQPATERARSESSDTPSASKGAQPSLDAEDMLDAPLQEDLDQIAGEAPEDLDKIGTLGGGAMLTRPGEAEDADESTTVGEGLVEGQQEARESDEVARQGSDSVNNSYQASQLEKSQMFDQEAADPDSSMTGDDDERQRGAESAMQTEGTKPEGDALELAQRPEMRDREHSQAGALEHSAGQSGALALKLESQQAIEHWLNGIEDNPGGLLKEKFRREFISSGQQQGSMAPW